jgi:hypothetical protein
MFCPYCGTEIKNPALRCINRQCERLLPRRQARSQPWRTSASSLQGVRQPLIRARVLAGVSGLVGGSLAVLKRFLPRSIPGFGNGPRIAGGVIFAALQGADSPASLPTMGKLS